MSSDHLSFLRTPAEPNENFFDGFRPQKIAPPEKPVGPDALIAQALRVLSFSPNQKLIIVREFRDAAGSFVGAWLDVADANAKPIIPVKEMVSEDGQSSEVIKEDDKQPSDPTMPIQEQVDASGQIVKAGSERVDDIDRPPLPLNLKIAGAYATREAAKAVLAKLDWYAYQVARAQFDQNPELSAIISSEPKKVGRVVRTYK